MHVRASTVSRCASLGWDEERIVPQLLQGSVGNRNMFVRWSSARVLLVNRSVIVRKKSSRGAARRRVSGPRYKYPRGYNIGMKRCADVVNSFLLLGSSCHLEALGTSLSSSSSYSRTRRGGPPRDYLMDCFATFNFFLNSLTSRQGKV